MKNIKKKKNSRIKNQALIDVEKQALKSNINKNFVF